MKTTERLQRKQQWQRRKAQQRAFSSGAEPAFPHDPSQSYQRVRNRGAGA